MSSTLCPQSLENSKPPCPLNYALPSKRHKELQLRALGNLSVQLLKSDKQSLFMELMLFSCPRPFGISTVSQSRPSDFIAIGTPPLQPSGAPDKVAPDERGVGRGRRPGPPDVEVVGQGRRLGVPDGMDVWRGRRPWAPDGGYVPIFKLQVAVKNM